MKTLIHVMVLSLMVVSPLCASTLILEENFEVGAAGTALNTLGWAGDSNILISSAVLDSGQSADWASGSPEWTAITKAFSYTPGAGDSYTLSATLYAPGTGGEYADVRVQDSTDTGGTMQGIAFGYNELVFGIINTEDSIKITPLPMTLIDAKLVAYGDTTDCYYRNHGAGAWTNAGQLTGLGLSLSSFDQIVVNGHGGYAGGIDSISLTAAPVPEPSSILMIVTGLFGLLAYAWRKRK